VTLGPLRKLDVKPYFDRSRPFLNVPSPARAHLSLQRKNDRCRQIFEKSSFNYYTGPEKPDILVITTGAGLFYSREAVYTLGLSERVGILKIGTTWPLPEEFILKYLSIADQVAFVEEGGPFLEENVKELCADRCQLAGRRFMGKTTQDLPAVDELTPETVIDLLSRVLDVPYRPRTADYTDKVGQALEGRTPERSVSFCAGCPHRATYWAVKKALALDGRNAFVLGDIGCYGMGVTPAGYHQVSTMQSMGSGVGLASGMGLLHNFGLDQPVIAVCGDATFFHAGIPALINIRQNQANVLVLILDNGATAMTGFQPHAGLGRTATGAPAPTVEIGDLCRAIGLEVEVQDPYDVESTTSTILRLLQRKEGAKVLILKRECALVRGKRGGHDFRVSIDPNRCLGDKCGCNRFCTRVFRCPGLAWDEAQGRAKIDQAICTDCGVCSHICPTNAIIAEDA
jgi:indolepyruvate ferredoxin oxidoreductase alpha subunit